MQDFKKMIQGIYQFMLNVDVPVLGKTFPLWIIFLFGAMGSLAVWIIVKFLK